MYELASMGELPLPQPSPPGGQKRDRADADTEDTPSPSSTATLVTSAPVALTPPDEPRHFAGSRRVSQRLQKSPRVASTSNTDASTAAPSDILSAHILPLHSDELGRLPLFSAGTTDASASTGWFTDFGMLPPAASSSAPHINVSSTMQPPHITGAPATVLAQTSNRITSLTMEGAAMIGPRADSSHTPAHVQSQSSSGMSDLTNPAFSSVVYDQALWNLSASLAPTSAYAPAPPTTQVNQSLAQQRTNHGQQSPTGQGTQTHEANLEQLMFALGADSSLAFLPDFASNDAEVAALSMLSNTPSVFK